MLHTSLYENHKLLGAKMISFGGCEMPRDYTAGTVAEVKACRIGVGIFDVSHMGEFRVVGEESLDFLQHIVTNDVARLIPGKAQYSLVLNDDGGVIDDVIVYCTEIDNYIVVVNAGCREKDWDWFTQHSRAYKVRLIDESDATALIAVQGPEAVSKVAALSEGSLVRLKRFHFVTTVVAGVDCTVSRTGYTGEDGFELFCAWDDAPTLWDAFISGGVSPCGLAARDVLRLEAAYPLYGHELNLNESPFGLGLGWAIKTSKLDFIGREDIVIRAQEGLRERLVGLTISGGNAIPREGQLIFAPLLDDPIGRVTSGTLSPMLGKGIAMARIGAGFADSGTPLLIDIRGRRTEAVVTKLPFYRGLDQVKQ